MQINLPPQKTVKAKDCKPGFLYKKPNCADLYSIVTACNMVGQATREYKEWCVKAIHFVIFTPNSLQGCLVDPNDDLIEIGEIVISVQ